MSSLESYPFPTESPYSGSTLPPYIHRERRALPPRALLLHEIRSRGCDAAAVEGESVDFMHMRKEHLGAVNRMLCEHFWPNIDVKESLEWPDYSVVVLYRGLVIGCGLATPEGYLQYLFVHPAWRSAGLATRLLYLLVARLVPPTRDITAHVAAGNPAVLLYQRFAFKPEEFIVDFYAGQYRQRLAVEEAGIGSDDPPMRNAFFMRLKR